MSKHTPRSSRWVRVSASEYRSVFGVVVYRAGAWEGTLFYEMRAPDEGAPGLKRVSVPAGRYKRPRNAMMGVEDRAREVRRLHGDQVAVAFTD